MPTTTASVLRKRTSRPRARPSGWNRFKRSLAAALASLADEQFLIISTKHGTRYVQFAREPAENGSSELRVEAVSNEYLATSEQLTKKQMAVLAELGWAAPTHRPKEPRVPHGSPNFYRDFKEPFACDTIARVCVETLTGVYRVRRPEELEYRSFQEPGGVDVVLPTLGIDKEKRDPPAPAEEQTYEEARAVVLEAIRNASGKHGLDYDKDGDVEVAYASATLFVHVSDSPRFVRVFSPVVTKVTIDEALLLRLNELNTGAKFVRFLVADGTIWASTDVFAHPLVPKHVVHACHAVGEVANDLHDTLKREFGERTVFPTPNLGALKN